MTDPSETETGPPPGRSNRVLEALERASGEATVGELAEMVLRAEGDTGSYETVHEDLFCRVLPALEDWNEIRFDVERGLVARESDERDSLLARLRGRLGR